MKKILLFAILIATFLITCTSRDEVSTKDSSATLKPTPGAYTVTSSVSADGHTLTFIIDQSLAKDVSHVLLQATDCSGNYLSSGNVVSYSSDAVVSYTTGAGTGCAFPNSYPFIKFDDSELMPVVNGKITYFITFDTIVSAANILIKSGSKNQGSFCYPFTLSFENKCNQTPTTCGDETGFAYGGTSATAFNSYSALNANRWGWTNGPLTYGNYDFPIYAGAGENDLSKGTIVGNTHISYTSDGKAVITISYNSNYSNTESAVYVGAKPIPTNPKNGQLTVAPGQYQSATLAGTVGSTYTKSGETYTITGLSGSIYVIAHTAGTLCK